jgi:hypothetical protein
VESGNANPSPRAASKGATVALLTSIAQESVVALFSAYGVELRPFRPAASDNRPKQLRLLGLAAFTSPSLLGCLMLGSTPEPLRASNTTSSTSEDWVAELTNQWAGRTKNRLLREGIMMTPIRPLVIDGQGVAVSSRPIALENLYESASGGVVYVGVVGDAGYSASAPPGLDEAPEDVLAEGAVLLF